MVEKTAKVRRGDSPHPGVQILKRERRGGGVAWYARWTDPETGRVRKRTFDKRSHPNARARARWAKDKAAALAVHRAELVAREGLPRETAAERREREAAERADRRLATSPREGVEAYLARCAVELRPATVETYRVSLERTFLPWCEAAGVETLGDLDAARAVDLRAFVIGLRKRVSRASTKTRPAKRGERVELDEPIATGSANAHLRQIRVALNAFRKSELVRLTRDEIAENLHSVREAETASDFLSARDCKRMLAAARVHDRGAAVRVAPVALAFLLTGMRRGELAALRWDDVDLDARDAAGRATGVIVLEGTATKTRRRRTLDLAVSPLLRDMLARLRMQRGSGAYVFGRSAPLTNSQIRYVFRAIERARGPRTGPQQLRRTVATVLWNSSVFPTQAPWKAAQQLGHKLELAERKYVGLLRGVPTHRRTIEAVLGFEAIARRVVEDITTERRVTIRRGRKAV